MVHLGVPPDGVRVMLVPHGTSDQLGRSPARQGQLRGLHTMQPDRLTFGRSSDNTFVLHDLLVSRRHAELARKPHGWVLTDLGSGNGTFVNGQRILSAALAEHDVIGIGRSLFQLRGDRIVDYVDTGDNAFQAQHIEVRIGARTLLHDLSFDLPGRALLAVVGPSGAGKSTLLGALTGTKPATTGDVYYAGRISTTTTTSCATGWRWSRRTTSCTPNWGSRGPAVRRPAALPSRHRRRSSDGTASTRCSPNSDSASTPTTHHDGVRRPTQTNQCGPRTADQTLPAVPRRTRPPALTRAGPPVMHTLRALADDGRTVVVVTHNVANLELCDRTAVARRGRLARLLRPAG